MKKNNREFLDIAPIEHRYRPMTERKQDFLPVELPLAKEDLQRQAARCMNCGIPFCHATGCPLNNQIPDFNREVFQNNWYAAWHLLSQTSSFPEFTSRVCPALCEGSCSAGPDYGPVSVRQIEKAIVETAFEQEWIREEIPQSRTGIKMAVIGSGPAGLAVARELNRQGHTVTVYEKNSLPGGLLRYGIPDFKLPKSIIDRRIRIMKESGIQFVCDTAIGSDISGRYLAHRYAKTIIATGTPVARDLNIPGRELNGIHFALDFLSGQNRAVSGEKTSPAISAHGKNVLVIGGGDTGSDCVGTAIRQGAKQVTQIEIMPQPPVERSDSTPWPAWPYQLRTSSSHEEGCLRRWSLNSLQFLGTEGQLTSVEVAPVRWAFSESGRPLKFEACPDQKEVIPCDLVFLALGFLRQDRTATLQYFDLPDSDNIYIAGDCANGPSLVVRAIAHGRLIAEQIAKCYV